MLEAFLRYTVHLKGGKRQQFLSPDNAQFFIKG